MGGGGGDLHLLLYSPRHTHSRRLVGVFLKKAGCCSFCANHLEGKPQIIRSFHMLRHTRACEAAPRLFLQLLSGAWCISSLRWTFPLSGTETPRQELQPDQRPLTELIHMWAHWEPKRSTKGPFSFKQLPEQRSLTLTLLNRVMGPLWGQTGGWAVLPIWVVLVFACCSLTSGGQAVGRGVCAAWPGPLLGQNRLQVWLVPRSLLLWPGLCHDYNTTCLGTYVHTAHLIFIWNDTFFSPSSLVKPSMRNLAKKKRSCVKNSLVYRGLSGY